MHIANINREQKVIKLNDASYQQALLLRKQLSESFSILERLAKDVKQLSTDSPCLSKIYDGVNRYLVGYLQTHMFTLKLVPRPTAAVEENKKVVIIKGKRESNAERGLLEMNRNVLEEQKERLKKQILEGERRRRFEDLEALHDAVIEIELELGYVDKKIKALMQ